MGSSLPSLSLRAANVMRCQAAPKRGALALKAIDTQQDKSAPTAVEEFVSNGKAMSLFAKEQLYLDCCAAYNVDGETLLTDEEYEKLKTDLTFEGSQVILMSREEIKFMVAANRYNKGKPIMSDEEFDTLRKKLKNKGSLAVKHEAASCKMDESGRKVCKADIFPDEGKNALLYTPALVLTALLFNEWAFWFKGWDPILSLILGSPFIVVGTYVLTNFIYFQSPYIAKATCPSCGTPQNIYFGDILWVSGKPVESTVQTQCCNKGCGVDLVADKKRMIVESISK